MREKLGLEYIKEQTSKMANGYKCLATEYIDAHTKYKNRCNKGHIYKVSWNNFQRGRRCPKCSKYHKRYNINKIKEETIKLAEGYKCVSTEYINNYTKMAFKCGKNHKFYMSWANFRKGTRCPICYNNSRYGEGNPSWKGGVSFEPYCEIWSDLEFKESIKERDNYTCQNDDCWRTAKRLGVHHINYVKKDCNPKNLITLCTSCNSRANINRKYWQKYYNNIIETVYSSEE